MRLEAVVAEITDDQNKKTSKVDNSQTEPTDYTLLV